MKRCQLSTPTRRAPALLLALALGSLAVGAAPGCNAFSVKTPDSFVSLERVRSRMYYKAVSPDNAVITISAFEHKDKGSLAYWTEILKREMTLRKGYALQAMDTVKTARGVEGRRLTFLTHSGSTKYRYTAHLFVTKKLIHVVETAAKEKAYAHHQAAFDAAVATFRPR
jgi:hypothetical protein